MPSFQHDESLKDTLSFLSLWRLFSFSPGLLLSFLPFFPACFPGCGASRPESDSHPSSVGTAAGHMAGGTAVTLPASLREAASSSCPLSLLEFLFSVLPSPGPPLLGSITLLGMEWARVQRKTT